MLEKIHELSQEWKKKTFDTEFCLSVGSSHLITVNNGAVRDSTKKIKENVAP